MSLESVKRGDEVFVVTYGHRVSEGGVSAEVLPVVAAGPKYVTAGVGWKKTRFHRDTGVEVTEYSARRFVFVSEAAWRAHEARKDLERRVHNLASRMDVRRMTDEQLHALAGLMEPSK